MPNLRPSEIAAADAADAVASIALSLKQIAGNSETLLFAMAKFHAMIEHRLKGIERRLEAQS